MVKLVLSLILAILLLIFTSQNLHEVVVRFIFGQPVKMPLILAMVGAFVAGFALASFTHVVGKSVPDEE